MSASHHPDIRFHEILPVPEDGTAPGPEYRIYVELRNRLIRESSGRTDSTLSLEQLLVLLPDTRDFTTRRALVLEEDAPVGVMLTQLPHDEGSRVLAWAVHLESHAQARGIGTLLHEHIEETARIHGRDVLHGYPEHLSQDLSRVPAATGVGSVPEDRPARFLLRHGYVLQQVQRISTYTWTESSEEELRALHAQAESRAQDYELVEWMIPTPDTFIDDYARLISRMATDAPSGDLVVDEDERDAEWVRTHEKRSIDAGFRRQITAARHRRTGELCAYNELEIGTDLTDLTSQEDTLVSASHRGHRLGMLVKTAGMLAWRRRFPDSPAILTYNAEENRHMLAINESIGFRPISYEGAWEKRLS